MYIKVTTGSVNLGIWVLGLKPPLIPENGLKFWRNPLQIVEIYMFFNIFPFPLYFFYMELPLVQFPRSALDNRTIQSSIMGAMMCTFWNTCRGLSTRIFCHWLLQCLYSLYSMWQAAADNLIYIFSFVVMVAECCREAPIVCWKVGWNVFNQHIYCGMGACGWIWVWWVGQHDQLCSSDRHLRPLYQVLPMPPYEYQC